ncbi:sporulation protein [Staphylococcus massiliensis]|uniref:Sporulation control protein n=1 Tax=Staphylococcus massiliensis S46 TaxID=1229783 RepID=K9ALZ5_9STAP|nr:sporulation protein [Staphylococcus massiliensis]EKU47086.1 hypothetical protein C273_08266 [Staphylococcus massiliensis S46]MCG3398622.1 sporulation protein [Staphylococcus massiliensis]MCG3401185.1 sporulation protein [Staphylococcus massiliensis]MCG3412323.1 sporulation protein [Staphylococcus massiliensis]PNZ98522.1 hypothetical protein CD133_08445 [Staphylococcus massiliensis CCUG 55927]
MFEEILTSLGIKGMTVETKLDKTSFAKDEEIHGTIILKAGESKQTITHMSLKLMEEFENTDETSDINTIEHELDEFVMEDDIIIDAHEVRDVPFKFKPKQLEFKSDISDISIKTHVYIENSIDTEGQETIKIER